MKEFKERDINIDEVFNRRISQHDGDLFSLGFDISQLRRADDLLNTRITGIEKKLNYLMEALISLCIMLLCIGLLIYKSI